MSYKYNIVLVDCVTNEAQILNTTGSFNDAVAYVAHYIEATFKLDEWLKCLHLSEWSVAVYRYFYIFPKVLTHKIHIIKFNDSINDVSHA